ncbi:MAG: Uncharacterized MFS-type transporter [uncultured Paraburkholderia sp.]|nr:MAG: Uncharacterized MFS-type transporter [uncultured Paraburkholderia sp.]CAH2915548.1 MAG: Uncharacterized MFS-type transporter [uncultured Paraburkholderia sp.]
MLLAGIIGGPLSGWIMTHFHDTRAAARTASAPDFAQPRTTGAARRARTGLRAHSVLSR